MFLINIKMYQWSLHNENYSSHTKHFVFTALPSCTSVLIFTYGNVLMHQM